LLTGKGGNLSPSPFSHSKPNSASNPPYAPKPTRVDKDPTLESKTQPTGESPREKIIINQPKVAAIYGLYTSRI
jgi:hypothetical protein